MHASAMNPVENNQFLSGQDSKQIFELELTSNSRVLYSDPILAAKAQVVSDNIMLIGGMRLSNASAPAIDVDILLHVDPTLKEE